VVLHYVEGELAAKDWQLLDTPMEEDARETVSHLVAQCYGGRSRLPRQILLPCDIDDRVDLARMLTEAVGRKVELLTPQRGAKAELVRLADENAAEEVRRATTAEERRSKLMEAVGRLLSLPETPHRMEAFDISNTGSSDIVASMTVHIDGRPLKRDYRRFKLKDMEHADDYASMKQVIERRFRRYLDGDEKFGDLPDVLLIDGGAGQVRAAREALETVGMDVPTFGMVKDDRHRTRALVDEHGREIGIQQNQAIFSLIGRIQEETHRFAIEFHRQQQVSHLKGSALDKIPGVGPARKTALLKHFKSVKAVKEATLEQLMEAVPQNTAQAVYQYFREEE
jgi:excinuclease ABC subunit C